MKIDCNRVIGNLLQGAFPPPGPHVARYAQVLVLCAVELQPHAENYPAVRVVHAPIDDAPERPMYREELMIARRAARIVRSSLDAGLTCLVTCHMGLNRSGLVSALALMLPAQGVYTPDSMTPGCLTSDQAIRLVRRARSDYALGNPQFVDVLAHTDGVCGRRPQMLRMDTILP